MSYTLVENFNLGIDRRRPIYAAYNGAVWDAVNCHLTRGGDLEKRKAIVKKYTLPAGQTFGLLSASSTLYTFGSVATPAIPSGITYQQLAHPDGLPMTAVLNATTYDGFTYVIAKYSDNSVYHFYNGIIVSSFVDGIVRDSFNTLNGIAAHLASLMQTDITYTTTVVGNVITVKANTGGVAFTYSASAVNRGILNDQNIVVNQTVANATGVQQTVTFTINGTPEVGDRYCIILDNKQYGCKDNPIYTPTIAYTFRSKVYGLAKSLLEFSGTGIAKAWNTFMNAGAGYLNLSTNDSGSAQLTGIEVYQGNLAIFSSRVVQIYFIREDASLNNLLQTLKNTGTTSPKSVLAYGDIDVFYLSDSGIRSIRARAPSNAAFVNDIGTTIDKYIRDYRKNLTQTQIDSAVAAIEPLDGRYMLALGTKIYVLSYFPSSQISGWTVYDVGFQISDFATVGDRIYARSGDSVYLYGGDDNETYDSTVMTVAMPFITSGKKSTGKSVQGIDVSSIGSWYCEALIDPRDLNNKLIFGSIDGVTWDLPANAGYAYPTHIAPVFTSTSNGYCSLSTIGITYEGGDEKN